VQHFGDSHHCRLPKRRSNSSAAAVTIGEYVLGSRVARKPVACSTSAANDDNDRLDLGYHAANIAGLRSQLTCLASSRQKRSTCWSRPVPSDETVIRRCRQYRRLDDTRGELAKQFLSRLQLSLAQTACLLGFADQSSFSCRAVP